MPATIERLPTLVFALAAVSLGGCSSRDAVSIGCEESDAGPCTWVDPGTGLSWQDPLFPQRLDWTDAAAACAGLALQGHHDWRLPTLDDLRSLARGCPATITGGTCPVVDGCLAGTCWTESCSGCEEMGGPSPEGCYRPSELRGDCMTSWTSDLVPDQPDQAWTVGFGGCHVLPYPITSILNTRCVRRP